MKILEVFPSFILGEVLNNISQEEVNNYIEYCNKLEYIDLNINGKYSKNQQILNNSLFSNLSSNIISYSKQLLNRYNQLYEDIQIITSWVNILNKNEYIDSHSHDNSYISGVFYLTESSPILFNSPLTELFKFKHDYYSNKEKKVSIKPQPNLLLLFPSYLGHIVPSSNVNNRYSIAFNIIPKGEFGPPTAKLYL